MGFGAVLPSSLGRRQRGSARGGGSAPLTGTALSGESLVWTCSQLTCCLLGVSKASRRLPSRLSLPQLGGFSSEAEYPEPDCSYKYVNCIHCEHTNDFKWCLKKKIKTLCSSFCSWVEIACVWLANSLETAWRVWYASRECERCHQWWLLFLLSSILGNLLTLRLIATDAGLVFQVILLTATSPEEVVFLGRWVFASRFVEWKHPGTVLFSPRDFLPGAQVQWVTRRCWKQIRMPRKLLKYIDTSALCICSASRIASCATFLSCS